MNCYHHPEKSAIGLCPGCYKAACFECASEANIFSCNKAECIQFASSLKALRLDSEKNLYASSRIIKDSNIFGLLSGLFFAALGGVFYMMETPEFAILFAGFGALTCAFQIFLLFSKKRKLA